GAGFTDPSSAFDATDGLITSERGVALGILTADCFPVVLADPRRGMLAVVHAGWRGVAAGIVGKAVATFGDARSIVSIVGPGVGSDHYEVGEDVASAVSHGAEGDAVIRRDDGRVHLDLGATIERSLRACGVQRVECTGICTACEMERFFSYRRDGVTGRQGLIAMRLA
ncbi:MAG: polyphenol oxidase family protein, partial [Actinomycetota bacterium]|nr:polyphenol oxidase family protein [Actinomycetota bacterium]